MAVRKTRFISSYRNQTDIDTPHGRVQLGRRPAAYGDPNIYLAKDETDAYWAAVYLQEQAQEYGIWRERMIAKYATYAEPWIPDAYVAPTLDVGYDIWHEAVYEGPAVHFPTSRERCVCGGEVGWFDYDYWDNTEGGLGCMATGQKYGQFGRPFERKAALAEVAKHEAPVAW
jgi:hypothetical protein